MEYKCPCGKVHQSRNTVYRHTKALAEKDVLKDVPKGQNGTEEDNKDTQKGQNGTEEDNKDVQKGQKGTDIALEVAKRKLPAPKARKKVTVRPLEDEVEDEVPQDDEDIEENGISPFWYLLLLLPFAFMAALWYRLAGKKEEQ